MLSDSIYSILFYPITLEGRRGTTIVNLSDSLSHNADVVYAFPKQIKLRSDTTLADAPSAIYDTQVF